MRIVVACIAALLLAGCTANEAEPPGSGVIPCGESDDLDVTIGDGEPPFEVVAPGSRVTIHHGPAGGWHILLAALVTGVGSEVSATMSAVLRSTGIQIAGDQVLRIASLDNYSEESCSGELFWFRGYVDDVQDVSGPYADFICSLRDEEIEISVTIEDYQSGANGTAVVHVVAQNDVQDSDWCQ